MANRLVSVDDNFDFPKGVADRQAAKMRDPATPEGSALAGAVNKAVGEADSSAAFNYFDVRRLFANVQGYVYGNSWARYGDSGSFSYLKEAGIAVGMAPPTNRASGGYRMQDTVVNAYAPDGPLTGTDHFSANWAVGTKGALLLGDLFNNLLEPDNKRNRDTALEACRAFVALVSAEQKLEQDSATFTYSSGWNKADARSLASGGTAALASGSAAAGATLPGVYVDIAIPANRVCHLVALGWADQAPGGTLTLTDAGAVIGVIDTDLKAYNTPNRALWGYSQIVGRIPAGPARTIRATIGNGGTTTRAVNVAIDCLLVQSPTPPPIIIAKPVHVTGATHSGKPALLEYLRTIPDVVAQEFANVIVTDPLPGWDPNTMLLADKIHPNPAGIRHLSSRVIADIKADALRRLRTGIYPGAV